MTDNSQLNSNMTASDLIGSPSANENAGSQTTAYVATESNRRERRLLIRAAVASVPVVLTFTAGKARAQDASVKDSAASPAAQDEPPMAPAQDNKLGAPAEDGELTPAEKLETFGLQRTDSGSSEDPFRDLDTVSEPVDLNNP